MIIDDHPEVTTLEDTQSNLNDDGFTEVVSRKQQKRLQDEERRKKEEQTAQVMKGGNGFSPMYCMHCIMTVGTQTNISSDFFCVCPYACTELE